MSVSTRGSALELGTPVKLFDATFLNAYFAMTADGQRFFANMRSETQAVINDSQPITVVLNWSAASKR